MPNDHDLVTEPDTTSEPGRMAGVYSNTKCAALIEQVAEPFRTYLIEWIGRVVENSQRRQATVSLDSIEVMIRLTAEHFPEQQQGESRWISTQDHTAKSIPRR